MTEEEPLEYFYVELAPFVKPPKAGVKHYRVACTTEEVVKLSDVGMRPLPQQARLDAEGKVYDESGPELCGALGPFLQYSEVEEGGASGEAAAKKLGSEAEETKVTEKKKTEKVGDFYACRILPDTVTCEKPEGKSEDDDAPLKCKSNATRAGFFPVFAAIALAPPIAIGGEPPACPATAPADPNLEFFLTAVLPNPDEPDEPVTIYEQLTSSAVVKERYEEWLQDSERRKEAAAYRNIKFDEDDYVNEEAFEESQIEGGGGPGGSASKPLSSNQAARLGIVIGGIVMAALVLMMMLFRKRRRLVMVRRRKLPSRLQVAGAPANVKPAGVPPTK